jgi:hypothetical protein
MFNSKKSVFGVGGVGVIEPNGSHEGNVFLDEVFDDCQPDREFLKNTDYEMVHPEPEKVWGEYGVFRLVGHGEVTNPNTCGKIVSMKGCLREDLHRIVRLDGKNFAGKVYVKPTFFSCGKASCPKCFKKGSAVREAGRAEERLNVASKRFGLVEHLVASVPVKDYHLPYKSLRKKAASLLKKLGVIGGMLIFHGFRYRPIRGWYWSPHFHVLGFIFGGYSRCRNCEHKSNCDSACDGFDSRKWKLYQKCKWYVKVFGKRKTVFGTAWYQLNHATYDSDVRNFHVATWFGVCSYRKLKITPENRKEVCPICKHELIQIRFVGDSLEDYSDKKEFFDDFYDSCGRVRWIEVLKERRGWRSGSYGRRGSEENNVDFEHYIDDCFAREVNV